ncbi:MAG: sel1 repeat family protein [Endomicrobia bacterium]|nr:sel1 repeat family protein [Endomicrobiia bacterium]
MKKGLLIFLTVAIFCIPLAFAVSVEETKKLAEQGNAEAQYNLGMIYYEKEKGEKPGIGLSQEAFTWMNKAAEQGYQPAIDFFRKKELEDTKKLAEQGNVAAQYNLGTCYYTGRLGVKQDYQEALKWYKKAAEQNDAEAQNAIVAAQRQVGTMYYMTQDYQEALKWYKKAAEQNDAESQFALSGMYYMGLGVKQDYQESIRWTKSAAEHGSANAQRNLGYMYYAGEGVKQDHQEAFKWWKKSAEQGNAKAQYDLGLMYYDGEGVKQDRQEAIKWMNKAAEQGYGEARAFLYDNRQ